MRRDLCFFFFFFFTFLKLYLKMSPNERFLHAAAKNTTCFCLQGLGTTVLKEGIGSVLANLEPNSFTNAIPVIWNPNTEFYSANLRINKIRSTCLFKAMLQAIVCMVVYSCRTDVSCSNNWRTSAAQPQLSVMPLPPCPQLCII